MNEIVVVTGCTRSGTSLMMQMLVAGGVPPFNPAEAEWPAFEAPQVASLPQTTAWLAGAIGRCVKLVDADRFYPPAGLPYRVVMMNRDVREQAKSTLKFMSQFYSGIDTSRETRRRMAGSLAESNLAIGKLFQSYGAPLLLVRFEDLLAQPRRTAERVAEFVPGLDAEKMAACVRPRSPRCYPGMMEFEMAEAAR